MCQLSSLLVGLSAYAPRIGPVFGGHTMHKDLVAQVLAGVEEAAIIRMQNPTGIERHLEI